MEYVAGRPIGAYCDENQLGNKERLRLFMKVCAAVSHAHRHLVIHRDLKPASILITSEGEPKLLDFGIAKMFTLVGGSFGGGAAGDASIKSIQGGIDRIVFLGAAPNLSAEKLKSRALFIVARDDSNGAGPRLPGIRAQYEKAPEPKELIVLEGSAHAQFLFQTDQNARVIREILRFLSIP